MNKGENQEKALFYEELIQVRRHLHQYPELGLQEVKTSAFIRNYLEKLGYEITSVEPTGLMAVHPSQKDKERLVVLRAEMDGLPIQEKTGLSYASKHDGCMHACGHDAIVATALLLAKRIAQEGDSFPICVRFLFEPAEEIGEGASRMLAAGALQGNGKSVADAFLMFHYAVDQTIGMAVHRGQCSAMIGGPEIHIHGKSSHWSDAKNGIDSIYAAALVTQAFHDINETFRGKGSFIAGISSVKGGEYSNIIADHVFMKGTIRACYEEDYREIEKYLLAAMREIEEKTGVRIEFQYPRDLVRSFANKDELVDLAEKAGRKIFGERMIIEGEDELFLSGDNAYRYFLQTKGLFTVFLAGFPEENYPLHHPKFQFDERILPYSLETMYELIKKIGENDI